MKQLKKTILTLVALLAVTTGAWAEDIKATASDIGKVLCTDGSIYATKAEADAANKTAVAMIAYIDTENNTGLALALSNAGSDIWCSLANAYCLGAQYNNTTDVITDMDGIANTDALVGHGSHTHTAASSARNYSVTRPEGASAWFLPSAGQWQKMIDAAGGFANLRTNAGMQSGNYWTSTEYNKQKAFIYDFSAGSFLSGYKDDPRSVRSAFEFDIVPSASSGPEVAWDKATKTGTFTMPGGNVTLEPEYYPQAALTVAPMAINDVPATTDGAIVKAGTVATIGSTETAQGTVMYYVSPTALDDAALLAIAADQWTADVPTAAHLAQGQAYVYYYVRGNDSGNDEENFSDGDILSANGFQVSLGAAPTYKVVFAEGTDPNEWKADPDKDIKRGTPVTVTYTGSKKVIGVKAEKKASAPSLKDALADGATVVITYTWYGTDVTTFTYTNNGGTYTGNTTGDDAEYFTNGMSKDGTTLKFTASNPDHSDANVSIDFNTDTNEYVANKGSGFTSFTISVNGTDVTSQLTEVVDETGD